jgi:hypothetical protein
MQVASQYTGRPCSENRNAVHARGSWRSSCAVFLRQLARLVVLYAYAQLEELKNRELGYSNQPPWPQGGVWPIVPSWVVGLRPVIPEL